MAFASFAVAMGSSFAVQPLREFWPQDTVNGKISSTPPERRSLHARGYLATYALELGSGYPWRMQKQTQPMESPHGVENLPLLPCTDKIVLIQVEALDYEMLTEKARAEYVMPFLHNLLDHAVLLRLDGTKKWRLPIPTMKYLPGVSLHTASCTMSMKQIILAHFCVF